MLNSEKLSFSGDEAVSMSLQLFEYCKAAGLDPRATKDWKTAIYKLFGVVIINPPDFDNNNYILAANHISDFDAVILGLLHPQIRIISKIGWATNKELMSIVSLHYDIISIYRDNDISALDDDEQKAAARKHNYNSTISAIKHLKQGAKGQHLLVFPQGTISDINKNSIERINPGFAKMAFAAKTALVDVFIEYPAMGGKTRIVCGQSYHITDRNRDHRQQWLDNTIALQNALADGVRQPILSEKHAKNNNPGEPYF